MLPLKEYIKHPRRLLLTALLMRCAKFIKNDELYLKMLFWCKMGKRLDLKNPKTFNEKLQWLKLYNRKPEYTTIVDKYAAKEYVAKIIGDEHIIPTLGVWNTPEEIDFDSLPNQFVLKTTHGGGSNGVIICRDKATLDREATIKKLQTAMQADIYTHYREWPYKDVPRRIIAEKYMEEKESDEEMPDYKFMCFNGEVNCIFTCSERRSGNGLKVTFFDKQWNKMPFTRHYPASDKAMERPTQLTNMIKGAESLSKKLDFSRIDFYEVEGKYYFGEITLFPGSGFEEFTPEEWDERLGNLIKLPNRGGVFD